MKLLLLFLLLSAIGCQPNSLIERWETVEETSTGCYEVGEIAPGRTPGTWAVEVISNLSEPAAVEVLLEFYDLQGKKIGETRGGVELPHRTPLRVILEGPTSGVVRVRFSIEPAVAGMNV